MNWFSKLLGGGKAADSTGAVGSELKRLVEADMALSSKTHADVPGHLARFILTGAGEDTLDAVGKKIDAGFGRLVGRVGDSAAPPSVHARNLFFFRSAGQDLDLTIRYLRVLHLALYGNGYRGYASSPVEKRPYVQQVLVLAIDTATVTDKTITDEEIPADGMTRATLLAIARAIGGTEDDLLMAMLLKINLLLDATDAWPLAKRLGVASEFGTDFVERPAAIRAQLEQLPYYGTQLLRVLSRLNLKGHPDYVGYFAERLSTSDKHLRKQVAADFSALPAEVRQRLMIERLTSSDARVREDAAAWLTGLGTPEADAALKARLEDERAGAVRRLIETHFAGRAMLTTAEVPDDDSGYTAIGGARIAIPPVIDFIPGTRPVFGEVERREVVALIEADNAKRQARYEDWIRAGVKWKPSVPKMIDPVQADYLIAKLNGVTLDPRPPYCSEFGQMMREAGANWHRRQLVRLPQEIGLREFSLRAIEHMSSYGAETAPLQSYLQAPNLDLRRAEQLLHDQSPHRPKGQLLATLIGSNGSYSRQDRSREFPADAVWPLVAANLHVIEEAFSTAPKVFRSQSRKNSILWLGLLPATPQRFLAPLLEVATSPKRESRAEARRLLADAPGIDDHLIRLLGDSKADTRRVAAEWLAERRAAGAEAALRDRLKKEKTEAVRAAMITALDRIGADISAYAGPAALMAEAEAGLKGAGAAVPVWLGLGTQGPLRWRDGKSVPDVVLHWWIRLAIKLKQPGGNGMFGLYLDQIHPDDAAALGRLILDAWTSESLRTKIVEEKWRGAVESLDNEAAETKGLLALARAVPPTHAAAKVRWYLKTHGQQSSQTSALLELLAAKADPQSLQVVLAAANRLKQKSVQKLAGELVARIAEDNEWTLDQLADRSVPTLGLDETGRLELPCGEDGRIYVARLDEALELALFNPDGRAVKALPAGDDEATVEAKASFADAKKTLTQAVTIQRERLFDAMCSGRVWPAGEWLSDIHGHPVLRKASERLVWLGLDAEGAPVAAFRPTPEGDFIGVGDAAVVPGSFAGVRLAHAMLVAPEVDAAWAAHLVDFEVTPLFAQFGRCAPASVRDDAEGIADRNGWVTDTFTLRGLAKKLGYDRGEPGDGGHFEHYLRRFPVAGLIATINFSGNCLPEENLPAVIYELRFARDRDGKPAGVVPPAKVPPVLLAECWHDYHAAAAKGAFDPDWEKRSPW